MAKITKKEFKEMLDQMNSWSSHQRPPMLFIEKEYYNQFWKDLEDWLATNENQRKDDESES